MRAALALVLTVVLGACGGLAATDPPGTGPGPTASPPVESPSARPSVDGHPLSELLPTSLTGVATSIRDMTPADRFSPRVFLKVVARLGKHPPDGEVALAFVPNATVYAVRIADSTGEDVRLAFIAETGGAGAASAPPPTEDVGGKPVVRIGTGGRLLYVNGDVFYYLICEDEPTAIEVLQQLP